MKKYTITKDDFLKMERAGRRSAEIEAGLYGSFTKNVVHKSVKTYTRKDKHKKSIA
jgi:hypothetical protein